MSPGGEREENYREGYKERGIAIFVDIDNNVLVTGAFHGDALFGEHYLPGWLNTDIFIVKIDQSDILPQTTFIKKEDLTEYLNVFPNPSNGELNIVYGSSGPSTTATIKISNNIKQEVFNFTMFFDGYLEKSIDFGGKASGFITLKLLMRIEN
ncbi:MAG: hypothetical protein M3Q58_06170 [Bacteroidota bacterium]|nr:hypothetical protein [Bacteroidota bacterium]